MSRSFFSKDGLGAALSGRATLLAFALLVVVGGSNAVAVRFSNLELPPFWGAGLGTTVPVASFLALVAGAACLAEGAVVFKLFPQSHPVVTNALAFTTGASILIVLSLVVGEEWILPAAANTWAAFIYLVFFGSVLLFYLYLYVLARWTASATAYSFLLFPVGTVPIAALLAGEVITASFIIGGALGLFGVWLGAISGLPSVTAADASPTTDKLIG